MQQDARQQAIENDRAKAERELAEQRAQDEALQAYLDQMSTLLLEKDLRNSDDGSEVRTLARARTLSVLERLDPSRKTAVVRFLDEADLARKVDEGGPVIELTGADLSEADLYVAHLFGADLSGANLRDAQGVTDDQLADARSLKGATMPNGQKYEEWLKDKKGRGEDGENGGPS